jgi:hypothetical protein
MEQTEKNAAAVSLGRRGGQATYDRYGKSHMQRLIAKRWDTYRKRKAQTDQIADDEVIIKYK